jgi:hypothetical protein
MLKRLTNRETRMNEHRHAVTQPQIAGLTRNWDFVPHNVPRWRVRKIVETVLRHSKWRPDWQAVRPITPQAAWTVYFLFAPDGVFAPAHRFALARLRDAGHRLMVVCATTHPSTIPAEVTQLADAIYWKALAGYDFSAYAAALREISVRSPHANVLVMNDSVYGPFTDVRGVLEQAPWELTGFTAMPETENHIQSYAFVLQDVTPARMRALSSVLFRWTALSQPWNVIAVQETRFARVASESMRVGAYWYGQEDQIDPPLVRPIELIDAGFPFLKRSLLGKHQKLQDAAQMRELLFKLGHPVPAPG